jgi:hypothetical protein
MKNLPIHLKIVLFIIILFGTFNLIKSTINPGIDLYNNSKEIELKYTELSQTQITNYDGYYLLQNKKMLTLIKKLSLKLLKL